MFRQHNDLHRLSLLLQCKEELDAYPIPKTRFAGFTYTINEISGFLLELSPSREYPHVYCLNVSLYDATTDQTTDLRIELLDEEEERLKIAQLGYKDGTARISSRGECLRDHIQSVLTKGKFGKFYYERLEEDIYNCLRRISHSWSDCAKNEIIKTVASVLSGHESLYCAIRDDDTREQVLSVLKSRPNVTPSQAHASVASFVRFSKP